MQISITCPHCHGKISADILRECTYQSGNLRLTGYRVDRISSLEELKAEILWTAKDIPDGISREAVIEWLQRTWGLNEESSYGMLEEI